MMIKKISCIALCILLFLIFNSLCLADVSVTGEGNTLSVFGTINGDVALDVPSNQLIFINRNDEYISVAFKEAQNYLSEYNRGGNVASSVVQGWNDENGYQYLLLGNFPQDTGIDQPISWRVLGRSERKALLVSEYILYQKPYDSYSSNWETSELKDWLNNEFLYDAFNENERTALVEGRLDVGTVFLLSKHELTTKEYGFSAKADKPDTTRAAGPTGLAADQGIWIGDETGRSSYFTRTVDGQRAVAQVRSSGTIGTAAVTRDNVGIRPAIWIDLDALGKVYGDGTKEYPFQK